MDESDPIAEFFAGYFGFNYNPSKSPSKEFQRMCRVLGLLPDTDERDEAREKFNNALARKFNRKFGTDADSLASWQALCVRVQIDPVPDTLAECRRVIRATHVNLVDLVDENVAEVRKFPSVGALKEYSVENRKIFPRENAHAGNLLKHLLREFFTVYIGGRRGRGGQGRRGGIGSGRGSRGRGGRGFRAASSIETRY